MMSGFKRNQHDKTGQELQVFHNHAQKIAIIIRRAYPQKHRLYSLAKVFNGGPGSPIFDLRDKLDDIVCRELPYKSGCTKIYFRNGQPDFIEPTLLVGVPSKLAQKFLAIQEAKKIALRTRKKSGLTELEALCIILCLHHIGDRVAVIGIGLIGAYHPDIEAANRAKVVLGAISTLIEGILNESGDRFAAALQEKYEATA